jgi:GTP-binding protein EngB required for normal cell division
MSEQTANVVFVGKTGAGKSQTIQDLTGNLAVKVRSQTVLTSCTVKCQLWLDARGNKLVDTVGIMDTNWKKVNHDAYQHLKFRIKNPAAIMKFISAQLLREAIVFINQAAPEGLTTVVITIKRDTFTDAEEAMIELMLGALDDKPEVWDYIVVAITNCEDLTDAECQLLIKNWAEQNAVIGQLFEQVKGRICCLGHNAKREPTEAELITRSGRLEALCGLIFAPRPKLDHVFSLGKLLQVQDELNAIDVRLPPMGSSPPYGMSPDSQEYAVPMQRLDDESGPPSFSQQEMAAALEQGRRLQQGSINAHAADIIARHPQLQGVLTPPGMPPQPTPGSVNMSEAQAKECCKQG